MDGKNKKVGVIAEAVILIVILQVLKEGIEYLVSKNIQIDTFTKRMVTMSAMLALSLALCMYARQRKTSLSVFPKQFGRGYIIFTCVAAVLFISTPSNYVNGLQSVLLLFYGSIVTPVYEELLFRGYIWNRFDFAFSNELNVYTWNVALFTLWHLGYMTPHLFTGNWSAILWKLAAGLGYGMVLGFVRLKTKNCYSTMLLHGILNIFMI